VRGSGIVGGWGGVLGGWRVKGCQLGKTESSGREPGAAEIDFRDDSGGGQNRNDGANTINWWPLETHSSTCVPKEKDRKGQSLAQTGKDKGWGKRGKEKKRVE